ncbi:uncharacterized protein EV422DRAFT_538898 [Fimicolochytrium jonesii]|uniref:uncharacterized protein n=1 Tax=Fimicolochytrium jonesii TaxID=1396493 RepID=UPI0022FEA0B5|nr:uncharacterized protein EV422DRAFT_538898 [Fimicolochytrium jonesii]KAI8818153.1 hypothetical protein EV422DRAFT_538898 [Fimicolochytrium jonesii]
MAARSKAVSEAQSSLQDQFCPFSFSSIPVLQALPTNPKTLQSTFQRYGAQLAARVSTDEDEAASQAEYANTLIIHAGSRYLRIGRASDTFPKEVPHVILRKVDAEQGKLSTSSSRGRFGSPLKEQAEPYSQLQDDLNERLREKKVRVVTNARAQVLAFNAQAEPQAIADHNDPYRIEWSQVPDGIGHAVGLKALHVATLPKLNHEDGDRSYRRLYPIQHGILNISDYSSARQCLADMRVIWTESIEKELDISRDAFGSFNVVWIVPNLFNKVHVRETIEMLLNDMGFMAVALLQESVAASYGAGITSACVVDIGAQKISIACVEDGMCVGKTRLQLMYGSDDVSALLMKLLLGSGFPYKSFDAGQHAHDWVLADELKEKLCTFEESQLIVNLCDFYVRAPNQPTLSYRMKVYDEVGVAPLLLLNPQAIDFEEKLKSMALGQNYLDVNAEDETHEEEGGAAKTTAPIQTGGLKRTRDGVPKEESNFKAFKAPLGVGSDVTEDGHSDLDPPSTDAVETSTPSSNMEQKLRESQLLGTISQITSPLDTAIAQSMAHFASTCSDLRVTELETRLRKVASAILLIGGGSLIPGLGPLLEERLAKKCQEPWFREALPGASTLAIAPQVMQNPREIDSRVLVWTGGAVFGRLDMISDLWLTNKEWKARGIPGLSNKLMFIWD